MTPTLDRTLDEFRRCWLPHTTNSALARLIQLLRQRSPLLIHGSFCKAIPQGCLASHIAWHHPTTEHLNEEAGVTWLTRVSGLNPATSLVVLRWDQDGQGDDEFVQGLLACCEAEQERRLTQLCESLTYSEPASIEA